MKKTFLKTDDGSLTLHIPEWNEQYHSTHGALAEALHVFIKEGFQHWVSLNSSKSPSILEIGFGTGLNAFLTLLEAQNKGVSIKYIGVEAYPLELDQVAQLNYPKLLNASEATFMKLHTTLWEESCDISESFKIHKQKKFFSEIEEIEKFNIIYFDAFGIRVQPELWTEAIFAKMFAALKPDGVLVTYAANGNARREMQAVGFIVERLPGPPGKREMLRATKHSA